MDPRYAERTATKRYRTTPLRALWQHGPYFHDGSAHDLQATILHLLGLDHTKLTFKFQGRRYRLTDVHGEVVQSILA